MSSRRTGLTLSAVILVLPILAGPVRAQSARIPAPGTNNVWYDYNDSETVFVFVHGILSDSRGAWLHDSTTYWPELVRSDPTFGSPSIFLGGYYTGLSSGDYGLRDAAVELYRGLETPVDDTREVLSKKRILFIAHSTGGIVVRHILVRKADLFKDKVVGLILIASPSIGSEDASRLRWLSKQVKNKMATQLARDHPFLIELDKDFKNLIDQKTVPSIPCLTGVEAVEDHYVEKHWWWSKTVMVDENSGGRYFAEPVRLAGTDHFDCGKPTGISHPTHQLLRHFFERKFNRPCATGPPVTFCVFSPLEYDLRAAIARALESSLNIKVQWQAPEGGFEIERAVDNFVREAPPENALVLGGSYPLHDRLADKRLLMRLPSGFRQEVAGRTEGYQTSHWMGWYRGHLAVAYRPVLFGELPPTGECTWDDVVERAVTSKSGIVLPSPRQGTGALFLSYGLFKHFGDQVGPRKLAALFETTVCASVEADDDIEKLADGDAGACINWSHDLRQALDDNPRGIRLVTPRDTPWEVGAASIVVNNDAMGDALRVLRWLLSDEAAELQARIGLRSALGRTDPSGADSLLNREQAFLPDRDRMDDWLQVARDLWRPVPDCPDLR